MYNFFLCVHTDIVKYGYVYVSSEKIVDKDAIQSLII